MITITQSKMKWKEFMFGSGKILLRLVNSFAKRELVLYDSKFWSNLVQFCWVN